MWFISLQNWPHNEPGDGTAVSDMGVDVYGLSFQVVSKVMTVDTR